MKQGVYRHAFRDRVRLLGGDCVRAARLLGQAGIRVDSVVTDPPYHLTTIVRRFGADGAAPPSAVGPTGVYSRATAGFMGQRWDGGDVAFRPETWAAIFAVMKPGAHLVAFAAPRTYHRMAVAIEDAGFEVRDQLAWVFGTGFPKSRNLRGEWEGWGTALKPAFEPICLARKPLIGTVAENVEAQGTGALNIDGCRIHADDAQGGEYTVKRLAPGATINKNGNWKQDAAFTGQMKPGRWPANLIHDGSDEVEATFASFGTGKGACAPASGPSLRDVSTSVARGRFNGLPEGRQPAFHGDKGSAARFFYSAKAGAEDRFGSRHPTVKPVALMRWLVRLVTPPGGLVLDPFAGTGTTGQAAYAEGMRAILVEREVEYRQDIARRLEWLGSGAPARRTGARDSDRRDGFDDLPLFTDRG